MCLFLVLPGYPTNKSRDARILEANCKHISNGINAQPIFISCLTPCIVFVHHISNCQATPKEVAQQQPPPPKPQQQSGEGAAFNNMAPTAAAAPGYPYAMSQAAAAPGAQGMSFIMQVRRFNSCIAHGEFKFSGGQMEMDTADDTFIFVPMIEERHTLQSAYNVSYRKIN